MKVSGERLYNKLKKGTKGNSSLTYEEIKGRFEKKGLRLVDTVIASSTQKLTSYDDEGYYYYFSYGCVKRATAKARFNKFNPYTMQNIQNFLDSKNTGVKVLSDKFKSRERMEFVCSCGNTFEKTWHNICHRELFFCPKCVKEKNSRKYDFGFVKAKLKEKGYTLLDNEYKGNNDNLTCLNSEGYRVHVKFSNIINNVKKNPYVFSTVYNKENYIYNVNNYLKINNIDCKALYFAQEQERYSNDVVTVYCQCQCGEIFHTSVSAIKNGQYRCKICSKSQSNIENKVEQWLKSKHIKYQCQKKFQGCKGKKRELPFDFYLPDVNICIEVDGEHHYNMVNFGGVTKKELEIAQKERREYDGIKTSYCENNNIKLIRIRQDQIERRCEEYKKILYNELIKK